MVICLVLNTLRILVDFNWENPYQRCIENSVKHLRLKLVTAQEMKFFIEDIFSKCEQLRSFLRIWTHLLKKVFMENFIFCAKRYLFSQKVSS